MMHTVHSIAWYILLLVHSLFLLRSGILIKGGGSPDRFDRLLMSLSQILLMPALLLSLTMMGRVSPLHQICAFMPLAMMIMLARKSFRRRHPLLLPLVNELWIAAAVITGVLL